MLIEVGFGQLLFDTSATGQPRGHSALIYKLFELCCVWLRGSIAPRQLVEWCNELSTTSLLGQSKTTVLTEQQCGKKHEGKEQGRGAAQTHAPKQLQAQK